MAEYKCAICGKDVSEYLGDSSTPYVNGTIFRAYGNYGSTQWDPIDSWESLVVVLCTLCLPVVTKQGRIVHELDRVESVRHTETTMYELPE